MRSPCSLRRVHRNSSPPSSLLLTAPTPCTPSRRASFPSLGATDRVPIVRSSSRATPRGRPGLFYVSAPSRSRSEPAGPPRFLVPPHSSVLRSVTPVRPPRQAHCGASVLPSALPTASTLTTNAFRSSITQPAGSLCTLRSLGYPRTTQHSVPAAGQLYRTGFPPAGGKRKVSAYYILPPYPSLAWRTGNRMNCDSASVGRNDPCIFFPKRVIPAKAGIHTPQ